MSYRVDQRFLIKLSVRVDNKGIEFGVIIRALLIDCRFEPIPILKWFPCHKNSQPQQHHLGGKINQIPGDRLTELTRQVGLTEPNRIHFLPTRPPDEQNKYLHPHNHQRNYLCNRYRIVRIIVLKVQDIQGSIHSKLTVIQVPTLVRPPWQGSKAQFILPVGRFGKPRDGSGEIIKVLVVGIELGLKDLFQLGDIASLFTTSFTVE